MDFASLEIAFRAGVGFWTLDPTTRILWTTTKLRHFFRLESEEDLDYETFFQMLHPDDTEVVQKVISDAMLTGVAAGRPWNCQIRVRHSELSLSPLIHTFDGIVAGVVI